MLVVGVFRQAEVAMVPAIGVLAAAVGCGMGAAAVLSTLAPYALPDTSNALGVRSGSGSVKGMLALAGMAAGAGVLAPVLLAALLLPGPLQWIVLPFGVAWGAAAVLITTYIAGDTLDRRGPEMLLAVHPHR